MSTALKKIIRDTLVDDASMRGFLGVSTTGSARVSPVFMEATGVHRQIIYSITDGPTDPGMDSQQGSLTFDIQVQATGGINPHITYGDIMNRISGLFDDQSVSGAAISGTASSSLLFLREGGLEVTYDEQRKFYSKILTYSFRALGG